MHFRLHILRAALAAGLLLLISCDSTPSAESPPEQEAQEEEAPTQPPETVATPPKRPPIDFSAGPIPYYTERSILVTDLESRSLGELSLIRNTIYARAGYEFSTPWLATHFREQDWYEPGGFDESRLSEIDRKNVSTVREFERAMTKEELRELWEAHWKDHGGTPKETWQPPGPWEDESDRIEASLLASALEHLRPRNELFDDVVNPGLSIPREWAGIRVGEPPPESSGEPIEVPAIKGWSDVVLSEDGRVTHIEVRPSLEIDYEFIDPYYIADRKKERIIEILTEQLGQPWSDGRRVVWSDGTTRVEPQIRHGCCENIWFRLLVSTEDPTADCGAKDGFESWIEDLERAVAGADSEKAASLFHYPFRDAGDLMRSIELGTLDFETPEEFKAQFPALLSAGAFKRNSDGYRCEPFEGYSVHIGMGELRVERIDGEWKAVKTVFRS